MSSSRSSSRNALDVSQSQDQDEQDRAVALLVLSVSLIDQALEILNEHLKEDKQLTHASKLMPGGSVGKHFRHVRTPTLQTIIATILDSLYDGVKANDVL